MACYRDLNRCSGDDIQLSLCWRSHFNITMNDFLSYFGRYTKNCESSFCQIVVTGVPAGCRYHDDVIKWRHSPRYWPFVRGLHRSLVNSSHKDQWRKALMFSLIYAWINGWVNNREAGDLWRHSNEEIFAFSFRGNYVRERPYKEGTPCSACPRGYQGGCMDNLCSKSIYVCQ